MKQSSYSKLLLTKEVERERNNSLILRITMVWREGLASDCGSNTEVNLPVNILDLSRDLKNQQLRDGLGKL